MGCSVGSGIGSLQVIEQEHWKLLEKGPRRVNPLMVPLMISNMAAGNVSIQFGLKGKNINVVTACATGTNSIGEAYRSIQCGEADVMVAGGTEAAITPMGLGGFAALTALSASTDPRRCSIPFDKERNGFVMGEGSGIVILEEFEHAQRRGAKILAEIAGYGATADAYHITSPAEDGSGAAKAMENAILEAEFPRKRFCISMHTEPALTITTCLRRRRSRVYLEHMQKTEGKLYKIHDRASFGSSRRSRGNYVYQRDSGRSGS